MDEHEHSYENHHSKMLICHKCKTVSSIEDALLLAGKKAVRDNLAKLLMERVFRKDAHDRIYAQVMADKTVSRVNDQARLI